jgi:YVTN family beta-propeller protein
MHNGVLPQHRLWLALHVILAGNAAVLAGPSNSHLSVSADGKLLAVANRDNGSVSIVDLRARQVLREIPVGKHPESVTFLGPSRTLAVAVYGDDLVRLIDAENGNTIDQFDVWDEPYGTASTADGERLYVACEYPGEVLEYDVAARTISRTFPAGSMIRGLALSEPQQRLYVTEYLTSTVVALSLENGDIVDRWPGTPSENLARQIVVHPRRPKAYLPHIRSRTTVDQGEGAIVPFVTVVETHGGTGRRRKPIAMDGFNGVFVVANPWEVALSADGRQLAAVFAGTNDLYFCRVVDDDYAEITFQRVVRVGQNPRAAQFSPDGRELYVLSALDFNVEVIDVESQQRTAAIPVCANPLSPDVHRGKVLFYSALQPMVGRRWISCSSCHPDGDADGRTWHNAEGLRNTMSLGGMAWTHPIHWSADRDEVQDFELTIRSPLMQGRGLIRGPVRAALGEPHAGLSADLDALAAYSNSHPLPLSPHAKAGLSEAARRGRSVFFSAETRCAECHAGPFFTDSQPVQPFRKHNVGTGEDDASETLGPEYDTPTLLGVYRTAPYLHHGRAATLLDVLTTCNAGDRHGKTSHLSDADKADLVEFLKALPYEDPVPAAESLGLKKITSHHAPADASPVRVTLQPRR